MIKLIHWCTATTARTIAAAFLLFLVVGGADSVTGHEIALASFYLLPILLIAWRLSLRWGLAASTLSAFVWLANNHWLVDRVFSNPLIPYWNALIRFSFFAVCTFLINRLTFQLKKEEAQSRLKSSMLHTVSHEFNNNLTVFSTGLFLLREMEAEPADEARVRILTMLDSTSSQLGLYVKNILNEARMEDGRFKLSARPLALRELVAESAATVQGILKQKEINLSVKMPEAPVFVNADREALALVVSNLLGNAIKYTPQKGDIGIEVCASGEPPAKILFSVEDSGVGIPLADLKKITAGFYRTEEGKAAAEGFGLGLRIVNELLALHGSRLEIASEKGKGSRFSFELPTAPPAQ